MKHIEKRIKKRLQSWKNKFLFQDPFVKVLYESVLNLTCIVELKWFAQTKKRAPNCGCTLSSKMTAATVFLSPPVLVQNTDLWVGLCNQQQSRLSLQHQAKPNVMARQKMLKLFSTFECLPRRAGGIWGLIPKENQNVLCTFALELYLCNMLIKMIAGLFIIQKLTPIIVCSPAQVMTRWQVMEESTWGQRTCGSWEMIRCRDNIWMEWTTSASAWRVDAPTGTQHLLCLSPHFGVWAKTELKELSLLYIYSKKSLLLSAACKKKKNT